MKKTLLFLSAAGCLVLPAFSHADAPAVKGKKASRAAVAPAAVAKREHVIYYITSASRTGSQIPMVYRGYGGRIDSASNAAVYGQSTIESTGALDVGTALTRLDSSITTGRGRH